MSASSQESRTQPFSTAWDGAVIAHTYKAVGGLELRADVYGPPGERGPRPVIVWLHGGALIAGHRRDIPAQEAQLFTGAGYTVVAVDYRLAPATKLRGIVADVRDACQWIRTKGPALFGADPQRMAVTGASAGGYLTLMTGFCVEPRPNALVSVAGYGDVAGPWYSRPDPFYRQQPLVSKENAHAAVGEAETVGSPGWKDGRGLFYLYCRQQGLWPQEVVGHAPDAEPASFAPFCPVRSVTADYPPTVLIHGDQDTDVPYEQSVMMADELARAGVEHEFITVRGGGHCSLGTDATEVAATQRRILGFLDRHLKPAAG